MTPTTRTGRHLAAALAGIAVMGLGACGSSSSPGGSSAQGAGSTSSNAKVAADVLAALAPTGKLRVAIPGAPPVLGVRDPSTGQLRGVAVDLAKALASRLGVPFIAVPYGSFPQIISASSGGTFDLAAINVAPSTAQVLDTTAAFMLIPHTYLVRSDSTIHTVAEADRAGFRIATLGAAGHTAALLARVHNATVVKVDSEDAAIAMLRSGQVDAYADGRAALRKLSATLPGSRLLDDDFFTAQIGLGMAKGHGDALTFLRTFIEDEKASGAVGQAIDRLGVPDLLVAPAAPSTY